MVHLSFALFSVPLSKSVCVRALFATAFALFVYFIAPQVIFANTLAAQVRQSSSLLSGNFVDTTQPDFQTATSLTNVDINSSPGNVTLLNGPAIVDQNTTLGTQGAGFNTVTWLAQTVTPAVTGQVTRVDLNLFSLNCSSVTMPNITVSIRNAASNLPTGADLASATVTGFCNGAGNNFTATFASPVTLTAGTQYALVWRAASAIPAGTPAPGYFGTVSAATGATTVQNPYAGGRRCSSSNSGATWACAAGNANNDHGFKIYMNTYSASGDFVSGVKDANPAYGNSTVKWTSLSWNASLPAGTEIKFQLAASNSEAGPFNFIGPDGTAATYFTASGDLLGEENALEANRTAIPALDGNRYLQYKAYFSTSNIAVTPTLNDVTVAYTALAPTAAGTRVAGTVTRFSGRGVSGATVTLIDSNGESRSTRTNYLGNFSFNDIGVGQTYIISVRAKGHTFENRVITIMEEITDLQIAADALSSWLESQKPVIPNK